MHAMQELTPNDCVVWEVPADVAFGKLPTYVEIHLFRYWPCSEAPLLQSQALLSCTQCAQAAAAVMSSLLSNVAVCSECRGMAAQI